MLISEEIILPTIGVNLKVLVKTKSKETCRKKDENPINK
jgi:hypothetical protein